MSFRVFSSLLGCYNPAQPEKLNIFFMLGKATELTVTQNVLCLATDYIDFSMGQTVNVGW